MEQAGDNSLLILFSGDHRVFSNDVNYPFRQENNLYYLTGINQSGIVLTIRKTNTGLEETLFFPRRDPSRETWTGRMLAADEAARSSAIAEIWDMDSLSVYLDGVLELTKSNGSVDSLSVLVINEDQDAPEYLYGKASAIATGLADRSSKVAVKDASTLLRHARLIKSDYEIQELKRAIGITEQALDRAMTTVEAGLYEYQIDGLINAVYRAAGATWGFPSVVGSGLNATTLHYEKYGRQLQNGELLLLDIGAEVGHYSADITRTIPVDGVFSEAQKSIYDIVLRAQQAAIDEVRPGATIRDVHTTARNIIKTGLLNLGLITERDSNQYRHWFMHGTSHFVGLDVHDVGDPSTVFRPGMVLTVEPGIYIREDALDYFEPTEKNESFKRDVQIAFERYRGIGVRIEDDLLVTEDGHEVLSAAVPKLTSAIEAAMR